MVCSRFCQAEVPRTGSNGPEGPNCCINSSRIDVILDHEPQPTTTKNLDHLSQMIRTGKIAKYDYGDQGQSMQHYAQPVPPTYDMTQIPNELPLFLSYMLSDVKDVHSLHVDNLQSFVFSLSMRLSFRRIQTIDLLLLLI